MIQFMHTGFDGYALGYAAGRRTAAAPDYGRAWETCVAETQATRGESFADLWVGALDFQLGYLDAVDDWTVEQRDEKQRRLAR